MGNLGIAYKDLGQVEAAIGCYQQALGIAREIGHRRGESADLTNLGARKPDRWRQPSISTNRRW